MQNTMTVNQTEYTVIKLLGRGKGGYSYLAEKDDEGEEEDDFDNGESV